MAAAPVGPLNPSMKVSPISAPVTKAEAEKTFWGLGAHFWMQIMDGDYHKFGPDVFDKGLHGKDVEPGFFKSMREGCEFASQHLTERLNVEFYKALHERVFAHYYDNEVKGVFMGAHYCNFRTSDDSGEDKTKHYKIYNKYARYFTGAHITEEEIREKLDEELLWVANRLEKEGVKNIENHPYYLKSKQDHENLLMEFLPVKKIVDANLEEWRKKVKEVQEFIQESCHRLSIPLIAKISIREDRFADYHEKERITVDYLISDPKEFEAIVQKLFDHYNEQMDEINLKLKTAKPEERDALMHQKIFVIAELFQMLEWLHPFRDGQGRSDLILQAKLLSEEGLNPAILDQPYFSSYSNLQETAIYLANGIKRWQAEREFFTSK